ncbi:MAG: hypothetical protein AAFQ82_01725 [Myxococcota bacterium]
MLIAFVAFGCIVWLVLEGMKADPAQQRLREEAFHDAFIRNPSHDVHALVDSAVYYMKNHSTVRNEDKLRQVLADEIELWLESYLLVLYRHMVASADRHGNDWKRYAIIAIDGRVLAHISSRTLEQFKRGEETVEALRALTRQLTRRPIGDVRSALRILESAAQ